MLGRSGGDGGGGGRVDGVFEEESVGRREMRMRGLSLLSLAGAEVVGMFDSVGIVVVGLGLVVDWDPRFRNRGSILRALEIVLLLRGGDGHEWDSRQLFGGRGVMWSYRRKNWSPSGICVSPSPSFSAS